MNRYSFISKARLMIITLGLCLYAFISESMAKDFDCENRVSALLKEYYPNNAVVQLKDLDDDLQEYFIATYHNVHPGCVEEDFDGDSFIDYALLLKTKMEDKYIERVIVLHGKGKHSYTPIVLDELKEQFGNFFIRPISPGRIKEWDTKKKLTLKLPGFELVLFEAASRVYFWEKGSFHFIQTSD